MNTIKLENATLVIFGASGDLTKRKLIPGLYSLYRRKLLPPGFSVLGIGRTALADSSFQEKMADALTEYGDHDSEDSADFTSFVGRLHYQAIDTSNMKDYAKIKAKLQEIGNSPEGKQNVVFYLSTPPSLFHKITEGLKSQGLNRDEKGDSWKRLVVEKPFGYDIETARKLNEQLHDAFDENQIYRIDHYLGKETVQNLLVLRFGNGIYEPLWNRNFIDRVEITAAESIGVEERGGYYEGAGALRDMFQNHLLHVAAMIAMEPPGIFNATSVRNETLKVFESMRPLDAKNIECNVVRGQYGASTIRGESAQGYREENGVDAESRTESYVAVKFFIDNWRWTDVPFYVRTGKRLPTRVTEAVIHFKHAPHRLFRNSDDQEQNPNQLILRIQPDEGILMKFNLKLPGEGFNMKTVNMDFHYADLSDVHTAEAYERLLLDSLIGDPTLYARSDAVEACWKFVDPILKAWQDRPEVPLYSYPAGTWGPKAARDLLDQPELDWRYPCRNLANDGEFCEL
jgi:glucose-6-phosphate 1-dehydrogenase